jgi:hypothetical protein
MVHDSGSARGARSARGRTGHPVKRSALGVPTREEAFDDDFDDEPVLDDLAAEPAGESDQVVLFSLDGKDYFVPAKIGPNVALAYMRDIRRNGVEHARAGILERILGREALDALADYDDLTEEDFEAVMKAVDKHVLGPLEKTGKGSGFVLKRSGG